jgi:hypothetical protein
MENENAYFSGRLEWFVLILWPAGEPGPRDRLSKKRGHFNINGINVIFKGKLQIKELVAC